MRTNNKDYCSLNLVTNFMFEVQVYLVNILLILLFYISLTSKGLASRAIGVMLPTGPAYYSPNKCLSSYLASLSAYRARTALLASS